MRKLFVFQDNHDTYREELECAYAKVQNDKVTSDLNSLTVDYLIDNKIEIVISNGLPKEWYYALKGLHIVTITFGSRECYHECADIVIDCLSDDDKRYFTGGSYSICRNGNVEIDEIVNLIKKLEWDSEFFGINVAYLSCMHLTENIMHRIEQFIREENIRLVEYLCNCHDRRSVRVAERGGFHFSDIRLTYSKILREKETILPNGLVFRKSAECDIAALRAISKDLYKDSRYFFDGNFDVEKVNEFYQGWVAKGVLGQYDDECWCLYDNHVPVGFCTVKYGKQESANVGLFGVDPKYQDKGLGKQILYSVFNLLLDRNMRKVFVVTQGRNYAAQRLYQSVGFRTESTQLWYHKWT